MNEELKKCPFCGGKAKIKATNKNYFFSIWVECACGVRTGEYSPNTDNEDSTMNNIKECENKAIKIWNRRVNDGKVD